MSNNQKETTITLESTESFLARGGQIIKVPPKKKRKTKKQTIRAKICFGDHKEKDSSLLH